MALTFLLAPLQARQPLLLTRLAIGVGLARDLRLQPLLVGLDGRELGGLARGGPCERARLGLEPERLRLELVGLRLQRCLLPLQRRLLRLERRGLLVQRGLLLLERRLLLLERRLLRLELGLLLLALLLLGLELALQVLELVLLRDDGGVGLGGGHERDGDQQRPVEARPEAAAIRS